MGSLANIFRSVCREEYRLSRIPFVLCLLISSLFYLTAVTNTATAATYYCDPVSGNTTQGDGTAGNPWGTLESVFDAGLFSSTIQGGDTVKLLSGYHGALKEYGYHNDDYITLEAADGNTPYFREIIFYGATKWILRGLTVSPELAPGEFIETSKFITIENHGTYGDSDDCIVEDCNVYSKQDSSGWSQQNWVDFCGYMGISVQGSNHIVRNNTLKNVYFGIFASGNNILVENNTVTNFAADGFRPTGSHQTWQYNTAINYYDIDENHSDGFQISTANPVNDLIIRGNYILEFSDPCQPFRGRLNCGIIQVDGPDRSNNWTIENNVLIVSWQGIWIRDATDSKIVNNTVIAPTDPPYSASYPYITLVNEGSNTTIRNNIAHGFPDQNETTGVWVDHNLNINDEDVDDLFVDYQNYKAHLREGSPAIDAGSNDSAPSIDADKNSRPQGVGFDIGAYEYVPSDPNNQAPVLQEIGNKSVNENSVLTFDVNATDPNGDTITYSVQNLPSGATFVGQTFSWTPGYEQADTYQVTFTASDGQAQDSETITITVNNVNRAPVLEVIDDKSVNENSILSFSISAADADGDAITYSVENLPSGATFGSQTLTWTPGYNQEGTYQVTFTASDSQAQDSEIITITVNNLNRAPVLSAIGNKSVYADSLLTFSVNATDPDGDAITYSANSLPTGATFTSQSFSWTPGQSQRGSYEVTFTASDSQLEDSETITITVDSDTSAPSVTNLSPTADSIQAATNTLVILHIADTGKGVDANSATIKVNDNTVYTGNTDKYSSAYGKCYRTGTKADYTFIYQSNEMFDYDQPISVTVNATDLADNAMDEYSYSFKSEMRSFGENKILSSGSSNDNWGPLTTVSDSSGNIWVAWPQGVVGSRDIYVGKLVAGTDSFVSSGVVQITNDIPDQGNPVIAVDSSDKLYLAWQDNRYGEWDIFVSTSTDGINWSAQTKVTDPNSNQINPAIAIDSSEKVYIAWEDDQNSNKDIYIASSTNSFATKTISQITSNTYDQTTPAIAVDSDDTVYVVWTDQRNVSGGKIPKPQNDIFGAASNDSWVNIPIVTKEESQSNPAIATEAVGSVLHLVWLDDTNGDDDIYYASTSNGLPSSPLTGSSIIDDTTGADQLSPVIITTGYTGNDSKVFACWRDERNADADLYFAETTAYGTNVFVGDDNTSSDQSEPAIGIDGYGQPYIVWINDRTDICYAGSTFAEPDALASEDVSVSSGATVGTEPAVINGVDDVSVIVPPAAYSCDVKITISRVKNPQKLTLQHFSLPYEFGPSGINFDQPVTITIPYEVSSSGNSASAYWYNPLTGTLSQHGITDVENIVISPSLHALRFKTTHFTQFLVGSGIVAAAAGGGGGGGGGGCSISPNSQGTITEFLLPYLGLTVVMIILKLRDARNRKARTIAKGKC